MKPINYKGNGEHSVRELELIIEQQAEELHLIKSGQKQLHIHDVVGLRELLLAFHDSLIGDVMPINKFHSHRNVDSFLASNSL